MGDDEINRKNDYINKKDQIMVFHPLDDTLWIKEGVDGGIEYIKAVNTDKESTPLHDRQMIREKFIRKAYELNPRLDELKADYDRQSCESKRVVEMTESPSDDWYVTRETKECQIILDELNLELKKTFNLLREKRKNKAN
jgi:hypothetical protein